MRQLRIRINDGNSDDELRSLYDWLQNEPDVRQNTAISIERGEAPAGELGTTFDLIQLTVDSSFQLSSLAVSIAAWRATRKKNIYVRVETKDRVMPLSSADSQEIIEILRQLDED